MEQEPPTQLPTAVLDKALMLLGLILRDGGKTPVRDLAASLGLPSSTLYRQIAILERHGLIARIGRNLYDAGSGLLQPLQGKTVTGQFARIARPHLIRLARSCRATANLGILENDMVTYLVKASARSRQSQVAFTRELGQLEAYCTGIGKILLSNLPEDQRDAYLDGGPFVALTEKTITDRNALRSCLDQIRIDDWASDDEEIAEGLHCLAVPVRDRQAKVVAAISLSFNSPRHSAEQRSCLIDHLRFCAKALASAI